MLEKPPSIANDAIKSARWDELTAGRGFAQSDAPALSLLCQWYKIAQLARDELDGFGEQTAYQNDMGDLKSFPQIATLKTASAEIRQPNRRLGITGTRGEADDAGCGGETVLLDFGGRRAQRSARAAG